jgi:DNA mismatch repair protein MutL
MSGVIKLLPDHVANQIAAGEVIQRPASVVKELLENSIDAGAKKIQLIIKDAGKTLIQVIDNGSGMSAIDALMCFERHATSKIQNADDLFNIGTKGFRGEALASIAAIAHITLKSKQAENELGANIIMEGSIVKSNEPCACPDGTSIEVKNLFYNVPARRKFLKSNAVETKHIIEEFQRVAFVHPSIEFILVHNDQEIFNLEKGNFRKRIVDIMGKSYNERLVPIEEDTDIIKVSGFICKPEYARKSRGEQYFFVNDRFIKNHYFHHAISNAFDELIAHDNHPGYFIQLQVDPSEVDINIHPTKTEVKFQEESAIYAILKAATRKSLNKFSIAPTLDFNQEMSFDTPRPTGNVSAPEIKVDKSFNPFREEKDWERGASFQSPSGNWEKLFEEDQNPADFNDFLSQVHFEKQHEQGQIQTENEFPFIIQFGGNYILTSRNHELMIIDQRKAHERVLYEFLIEAQAFDQRKSQQLLFPETIELTPQGTVILEELLPELNKMGFDIAPFGPNTFTINGTPSDLVEIDVKDTLEHLVEQFQLHEKSFKEKKEQSLAKNMATKIAVKGGQKLQKEEMEHLVKELFACDQPYKSPSGKNIIFAIQTEDLIKYFS